MDNNNNLNDILNNEINKLIAEQQVFLDENWNILNNKYNHRTEIKDIKNNNIKIIKDVLLNQLGYIPVFYFLNCIYGTSEYPGLYKEIDKGLLILYHMVSGKSGRDMHEFISYTTYYSLYKKFWHSNYKRLLKKIDSDLNKMFSNIKIRIISSLLNNPSSFKNVTLYIDGHDGKIKYYDPDTKTKDIKSYKLDGPGLRTQIVVDSNQMIIYISKSDKCGKGSDGTMFLEMKLYNKMHIGDCLAMDGGYNLYINKFKEESLNKGKDFSDKNFISPIRKENNKNLTAIELQYNKRFGSFRSEIENQFSVLASKFNRFNNNTSAMQITDIKYYNLQFKLACLLKNIWQMVDKYKIPSQPHHKLWYTDNFEFPIIDRKIDIVVTDKITVDKNFNEMLLLQKDILNLNIGSNINENSEIENSDNEEDTIMEEVQLKHKKLKKVVAVVIPEDKN